LEEPLQFGDGGRLFGILTLPIKQRSEAPGLPVFVLLNAGALQDVKSRELASMMNPVRIAVRSLS
ncbi:MAG: hypothetical protein ACKVP2_06445, partial [Burkholderiales bacterium]